MKGPALVVMARAPVAGQVKTRLQPELTRDQCAAASLAFLRDVLDLAVSLPQCTPFLAFTPPEERAFFESITPQKLSLTPQTDGDIGQRMYHLMRQLEEAGYSPVILIGSDIPTLQPATLVTAIKELGDYDLCLGPSRDGGYYLIGARHIDERIFRDMQWSTPNVFTETVRKAHVAGLSLTLLEEYGDVDTFADLQELQKDIQRLRGRPGERIPLHTEAWMQEIRISFGGASPE